jgi:copper chaperone CopZ
MCEAKPAAAAPAKAVKGALVTETFKVTGMKCQKCVNGVTKALTGLTGVAKVDVKLTDKLAVVTYGKGQQDLKKLNAALKGHFTLAPYTAAAAPATAEAAPVEAAPGDAAPAAPQSVN